MMKSVRENLFSKTISILKQYRIRPRRKYSQNFLINPNLIKWHLDFANINSDDEIVEIGPGLGFLTEALARKAKKVLSIEIDREMIKILRDRLASQANIEIIESDVLTLPTDVFNGRKIVSNTPYKISSPLLFKIFKSRYIVGLLTFQAEFARRLSAKPGDPNYGRLSISASRAANVRKLKMISRKWFYPPPKVDSILLKIEPNENHTSIVPPDFFYVFLRDLFSYKNKILKNALKFCLKRWKFQPDEVSVLLNDLPQLEKTVRDITPDELETLAKLLFEQLQEMKKLERINLSK